MQRNVESLRGSIASSTLNYAQPQDVFNLSGHKDGGKVWEFGWNSRDGKLLNFLEVIASLRDSEARRAREKENAWRRLRLAGPHPTGLPKILTLGNGVGRCPAITGRSKTALPRNVWAKIKCCLLEEEKKCCDIVPTGHIAVHVQINSSLCKRHRACQLVSLGNTSRSAAARAGASSLQEAGNSSLCFF